jgi:hypothetical protein
MHKHTKYTLLHGEGIHQHTLYGRFESECATISEYGVLSVTKDSVLRHERPDGTFGEHKALPIAKSQYVMARQVEYNPFNASISRVWD